MALTRPLNSFASTTPRISAGRPFQAWIGRCGTDRRVASSRHLRVWSTELRDASERFNIRSSFPWRPPLAETLDPRLCFGPLKVGPFGVLLPPECPLCRTTLEYSGTVYPASVRPLTGFGLQVGTLGTCPVEVFTGQIFSPNSSPPHEAGSKSITPQIQNLMGQPPQSISK